MDKKLCVGSQYFQYTKDEKEEFNLKLLDLETKFIKFYIKNRLDGDIKRLFNLPKFIIKLARINKMETSFENKVKHIKRFMYFYGLDTD